MWQYLLKRTLLLLVTLFGIAVVSFLVVTSAPGDPASLKFSMQGRGSALSKQVKEKNQELYFLDRPRLLNLDPPTRTRVVTETLEDLQHSEELVRDDAKAKLGGQIGTAGLDLYLEALPGWVEAARAQRDQTQADLERLQAALDAGADDTELAALLEDVTDQFGADVTTTKALASRSYTSRARSFLDQGEGLLARAERDARALLAVLAQAAPATRGGPEVAEDATLQDALNTWTTWWEQHQGDYAAEAVSEVVATYLALRPRPRLELAAGSLAAVHSLGLVSGVGPVGSGTWEGWWEERQARLSGKVLRAGLGLLPRSEVPSGAPLEALERVGQVAAPALYAALQDADEGSWRERVAAFGLARVCKKTWDLTTDPDERAGYESEWESKVANLEKEREDVLSSEEASEADKDAAKRLCANQLAELGGRQAYVQEQERAAFEDHRRRWRDWWYRAEEQFVDFGPERQWARAFSQTQFGRWLVRFVSFDFGDSYKRNLPVAEILLERVKPTLILNACSIFLVYLLAVPLGIFSATHQGSLLDRISTVLLYALYSIPTFWAGAMLILLCTGGEWGLPAHGFSSLDSDTLGWWEAKLDVAKHLILPVACLTYVELAYVSRQMRTGMLDVIRQDYIRTAKAKGLPERVVVFKHALRNSLIPILTLMGNLLPLMFAGSVIIETIFTIDGLGKLTFDAMVDRDYPVIMANLVISGFLTLLGILLSDLAYALVDPRIEFR